MTKVINLFGGPGSGKCLKQDTLVLMFNGTTKKVQDIIIGDQIMGNDSSPRKVLKLFSGKEQLFTVTPVKGDPFEVTGNHVLSVKYKKYKPYEETFNYTVNEFLTLPKARQERSKLYRTEIEFQEQSIPIDPYFIGLWLGDGLSSSARISSADTEIINYLQNLANQFSYLYFKQHSFKTNSKAQTYALSVGQQGGVISNPIGEILKSLNLLNNKHIPNIYKINSKSNRLKLLAGLIDSDGSKSSNGCYDFISKYKHISDDVIFIETSIGYSAYLTECEKSCQNGFTGTYYRVSISGVQEELPVLLNRKKSSKRLQIKNVLRTGFTISKNDKEDNYYGFELDGNHLFCLADFTVTHNSTTAAGLFYNMKIKGIKCELVTEYAKDMTYEKRNNILEDQLYILAKQNRKLARLNGVVDYIITDSPLLLGLLYTPSEYYESFSNLTHEIFQSYNNQNFFINRTVNYQTYGRNQTEDEAKKKDAEILELLSISPYSYTRVNSSKDLIDNIMKDLRLQ